MRGQIRDNKLVITTEAKTFYSGLYKNVDNNLKHQIFSIIKHNELLAEHATKNAISQLLFQYKLGNNTYKHGKW